jgi:hypothetical protein
MVEGRRNLDESRALLGDRPRPPGHHHAAAPSVTSLTNVRIPKVHKNSTIVNILCLVMFMAASAGGFLGIPQARIIEDALCHEYYGKAKSLDSPIDENLCKVESIQSNLAFILAVSLALSSCVQFISAFPWTLVADRYDLFCLILNRPFLSCYTADSTSRIGRKPVLALNLGGE